MAPPPCDWITLNTDGSMNGFTKKAGCGGLLRNENSKWIGGFSFNIGSCTAFKVELWGIDQGLKLAWTMGLKKVRVECDSKAVIESINSPKIRKNHPNVLIRNIQNWKNRKWNILFVNIYREGNRCADCLAHKSLELDIGFHFWDTPPNEVVAFLSDDEQGIALPRLVCN
ncbi:hypothetical protein AHAS_Ahas17G0057400 [Arachis hypogaea]